MCVVVVVVVMMNEENIYIIILFLLVLKLLFEREVICCVPLLRELFLEVNSVPLLQWYSMLFKYLHCCANIVEKSASISIPIKVYTYLR